MIMAHMFLAIISEILVEVMFSFIYECHKNDVFKKYSLDIRSQQPHLYMYLFDVIVGK